MKPHAALVALSLCALLSTSCSGRSVTGNPVMVNPDAVSPEPGSIEEIRQMSQKAINDFINCPRLEANRSYRVVLGRIVNRTGIPDYDEGVVYNRVLSEFVSSGGDRFNFLEREGVIDERDAQLSGAVASTQPRQLAGADLVLTIELRSLRGPRTTTIQYQLRLTDLEGNVLCSPRPTEFKKRF